MIKVRGLLPKIIRYVPWGIAGIPVVMVRIDPPWEAKVPKLQSVFALTQQIIGPTYKIPEEVKIQLDKFATQGPWARFFTRIFSGKPFVKSAILLRYVLDHLALLDETVNKLISYLSEEERGLFYRESALTLILSKLSSSQQEEIFSLLPFYPGFLTGADLEDLKAHLLALPPEKGKKILDYLEPHQEDAPLVESFCQELEKTLKPEVIIEIVDDES